MNPILVCFWVFGMGDRLAALASGAPVSAGNINGYTCSCRCAKIPTSAEKFPNFMST